MIDVTGAVVPGLGEGGKNFVGPIATASSHLRVWNVNTAPGHRHSSAHSSIYPCPTPPPLPPFPAPQVIGYGFAGLFTKYLVEPAHMWWPGNLVAVSLFR